MFDKFSEFAEEFARGASRRQFLERLGRTALIAAAGAAALLARPTAALAAKGDNPRGYCKSYCASVCSTRDCKRACYHNCLKNN